MIFDETRLAGAYTIDLEPIEDERGFFAATVVRARSSPTHGLDDRRSRRPASPTTTWRGTLRGMHWQVAPHAEVKLVRCVRGAIYDVIVDLRPDSDTFAEWIAVELTEDNRRTLYVPEGFAHGYLTPRGRKRGLVPDVHSLQLPTRHEGFATTILGSVSTGRASVSA